MPRSYASDLLVDDIDLDGERVAGPPYRAGRRRSDVFMIVVAAAASAAVLFNALALQQARQGTSSRQAPPLPAAAPADIRQVETPPSAAVSAAPAATGAAPAEPLMATPVAPLPPSKPAPPRPAAPAAASVVTPSVSAPSAPAQGLVPPGEVPVSPRIIEIQKALARLGYGPIRIDGRLGAATEEAITRFERDRRLPVTGQISDRVIRELNAVSGLSIQ